MNRYPVWKYWIIGLAILLAFLYSTPTLLFGTEPGLIVTFQSQSQANEVERVKAALDEAGVSYTSIEPHQRGVAVQFSEEGQRPQARERLNKMLPQAGIGPMQVSAVPSWLQTLGGHPMPLGLDLRGGVHLLMDVDVEAALEQTLERYLDSLRTAMQEAEVRYRDVELLKQENTLRIKFDHPKARGRGLNLIASKFSKLRTQMDPQGDQFLRVRLAQRERDRVKERAVEQSITTIRSRVNQLGVSEPVIQQQGEQRIVVQLPGIQDTARAKKVIGSTAQLEFKLVDEEHSLQKVLEGRPPPGSEIRYGRGGQPYLLKERTVLTGKYITDARAGFGRQTNQPLVHVSFDDQGTRLFEQLTGNNVGRRMAILLDDQVVTAPVIREEIPGGRAQITGMASSQEAHDVALMLRAGALPAPVKIVEERTVGPTLGQDSIKQGFRSIVLGFVLVLVFMAVYYRLFGLVADLALALNLLFIVAVMSLLQATLTLPGIAGIVLTVGMAVDANTLIFERIREEVRVGNTPHAAIHAGYTKALSTIADANITTLIAALVLFQFGSGPVRGFAMTLSVGILTSMFTAIMVTRAVINLAVGGRRLQRLAIGED